MGRGCIALHLDMPAVHIFRREVARPEQLDPLVFRAHRPLAADDGVLQHLDNEPLLGPQCPDLRLNFAES